MKPFDFSYAEQLIGKAVKNKKFKDILLITHIDKSEVTLGDERYYFNDLLNDFTFLDGSPCGVEEEFNLSFIEVLENAKPGDKFLSETLKNNFELFKDNNFYNPDGYFIVLSNHVLKDKYKKL